MGKETWISVYKFSNWTEIEKVSRVVYRISTWADIASFCDILPLAIRIYVHIIINLKQICTNICCELLPTRSICWNGLPAVMWTELQIWWEMLARARICKHFKEPRNRFPAWRAIRQPYVSYRVARLHRLTESIPRSRFVGSLNVYKYGLCAMPLLKFTEFTITKRTTHFSLASFRLQRFTTSCNNCGTLQIFVLIT